MAWCKTSSSKRYAARVRARDCNWLYENICCIDNVLINMDNTESLIQKTQDWCKPRNLRRLTANISYDIYKISNAKVLELMFPNGAYEEIPATTVVWETQTIVEWQWETSTTEDQYILIQNYNADGTVVAVTDITGSVDGVIATSEYTVEIQELCNDDWSKFVRSFIKIPAWSTLDIAQDLVVTYDYTPRATGQFSVRLWAYEWSTLDIVVEAVNKADPTDYMTFEAEAYFSLSGGVFQFNDKDDELTELAAIPVTLELEEGTDLVITGLSNEDDCGKTCS